MNIKSMNPKLNPKWLDVELTHKHGGNGYAICELLPPDYVRVCSARPKKITDERAFLAWVPLLSPFKKKDENGNMAEVQLPEESLLPEIRNGLALGRLRVVNTRIVVSGRDEPKC